MLHIGHWCFRPNFHVPSIFSCEATLETALSISPLVSLSVTLYHKALYIKGYKRSKASRASRLIQVESSNASGASRLIQVERSNVSISFSIINFFKHCLFRDF